MILQDTDIDSALSFRKRREEIIKGEPLDLLLNPYRFGGGAPTDPDYASVTALLHMNGANGSSTFTDQKGGTYTRSGNAQISTAQSRWGGASGLFDGSGDYVTRSYNTTSFDWWTTTFTVELWIRPTSFPSVANLIGNMASTSTTNYWSFGVTSTGLLQFGYFNGSTFNTVTSTGAVSTGTWTHVAMTHASGTISLYFGTSGTGNRDGTAAVSGTPQSNISTTLTIGQVNNVSFNGYMDDLRITKGAASVRYSGSTYTVPAAQFPDA
jgi:hypothetical protein